MPGLPAPAVSIFNGAGRRFTAPGIDQPLPDGLPAGIAGKKVSLGVRSEHVLVDANAPHTGTVSITEPLGDATLVHFDYGQGKTLVAKVPPTTTLGPGSTVRFRFALKACHLFDASGGARLN